MTLDDVKNDLIAYKELSDGTMLIVYPLLYGRARLTISSKFAFSSGSIDNFW